MQVRFKRAIKGDKIKIAKGDVRDYSDARAKILINSGVAEAVEATDTKPAKPAKPAGK